MRDVAEQFNIDNTIRKVDGVELLFKVLERTWNVDRQPVRVDNPTIGLISRNCAANSMRH